MIFMEKFMRVYVQYTLDVELMHGWVKPEKVLLLLPQRYGYLCLNDPFIELKQPEVSEC
jgi:hypothetical protein